MAIFLNENFVNKTTNNDSDKVYEKLMEELHISKDAFIMFSDPDSCYEIMYEAEIAYNTIKEEMMLHEMTIIKEESTDGTEASAEKKETWWSKFVAMIKKWWEQFKTFLGKVWDAIKNFFKSVYEFFFKHDQWKKAREKAKRDKEEKKAQEFNAKVDMTKVLLDINGVKAPAQELVNTTINLGKKVEELEGKIGSMKEEQAEQMDALYKSLLKNEEKTSELSDKIKDEIAKVKTDMNARSQGVKVKFEKIEQDIKAAESTEGTLKQTESIINDLMAKSVHYGELATKYAEKAKEANKARQRKKAEAYKKLVAQCQKLSTQFRESTNYWTSQANLLKTALKRVTEFTPVKAA